MSSGGGVTKKERRTQPRHLPFSKDGHDGQSPLYHCSRCKSYLPETAFIPSVIVHRKPTCRACSRMQLTEHRHRSMDHEAAAALYAMEHTRFGRQGLVPVELVTAILDASGRRSAISGATEKLRLRRFWEDLPLSLENAVVLTVDENRRMTNKSEAARLALFPEALVTRMTEWRTEQLRLRDGQ